MRLVQSGKGTGSQVQIMWVIFRLSLYTVENKGCSEGVVAKRSVLFRVATCKEVQFSRL